MLRAWSQASDLGIVVESVRVSLVPVVTIFQLVRNWKKEVGSWLFEDKEDNLKVAPINFTHAIRLNLVIWPHLAATEAGNKMQPFI